MAALRPWERRLGQEALRQWLLHGITAGLAAAGLVLAAGWFAPVPPAELRGLAFVVALAAVGVAALVGLWPRARRGRVAQLEARLPLGDRVATAWTYRRAPASPIVALQRRDALEQLTRRKPTSLTWRPTDRELGAVAGVALLALLLTLAPSPQQRVLDERAAEARAVSQAGVRLETLRQDAAGSPNLTAAQQQQLDELLLQAQIDLARVATQKEAGDIVARTQAQVAEQLGDPNRDLRDEALAAMSETLAAEPQTRALGEALQHTDPRAAGAAMTSLAARADRLSDVERQALSRALQRAANVGRGEPSASAALREAARAVAAGEPSAEALRAADDALRRSTADANAQAAVRSTTDRLDELRGQLAAGRPPGAEPPELDSARGSAADTSSLGVGQPPLSGTPVAVSGSGTSRLAEPAADRGAGAGVGGGSPAGASATGVDAQAAENVFVPGRTTDGAADQDLTDTPFTLRGAPRPYRDVLSQYTASSRDYVDRPDVSPAARDMVKAYFDKLQDATP